ncbi:acyltransferase family protein [Pseudomonas duriflava]|nr:acyltransferase [Pseudomonas duriflava]
MNRFTVLDSFRGICAIAVVLFHTYVVNSFAEMAFFKNAYLFVEFFFILSGFVLYHTYSHRLNGLGDYKNFVITRTLRLYPLHLAMLAVYIALECGKLIAERSGLHFNDGAFAGATAPDEFLPNLLLLQAWLSDTITGSFNYPSWSISIEYYLYLLFGAIMIVTRNEHLKLFFLISLLSFIALCLPETPVKDSIFRGGSCFFAGACTYVIYTKIKHIQLSQLTFTALELISVICAYSIMVSEIPHKGVIASLLFCGLILIFSFERGSVSRLLQGQYFIKLGNLSFSIYLTHAAVLYVFKSAAILVGKLTGKEFMTAALPSHDVPPMMIKYMTTGSAVTDDLVVLAQLVSVIFISRYTYKYIELTGVALGKRLTKKKLVTNEALQNNSA